jgi:hypothetical protein
MGTWYNEIGRSAFLFDDFCVCGIIDIAWYGCEAIERFGGGAMTDLLVIGGWTASILALAVAAVWLYGEPNPKTKK